MKIQRITYLSLGTNQGNKLENLQNAINSIADNVGDIQKVSSVYKTASWGFDSEDFLFDDEIIFSRTLTVPHPKMLERKFVLVPLVEIAGTTFHPIEKKQLAVCLKNCNDSSEISLIEEKLKRPIPISEKYNYIAIEGNIGAGKTSLAKMMSDEFNVKII